MKDNCFPEPVRLTKTVIVLFWQFIPFSLLILLLILFGLRAIEGMRA